MASRGRIDRRTFIAGVSATAAGATVLANPLTSRRAAAASSNVCSAHAEELVTGTVPSTVQESWVQAAMDAAVKAMAGKPTVAGAWEALFAGVTTTKKIAIKINCLKKECSPQLATIKALVTGLRQMCGGSFPSQNISLFDNTMPFSGLSGADRMAAVYGGSVLNALGITYSDPSPQYSGATFQVRGKAKYPATYLDQADYGIDLTPLKRHQYYAGGISGVIKNMMGACSESKDSFSGAEGSFHDNAPFQSFVDLFKNYMGAKLQVYVVDMLFAAATENASGWSKVVKRITLSTDPCAIDAYVADTLNDLGIQGTKGVPQALASAGLGNASYTLVEPTVSLGPGPVVAPTRDELDAKIRARREGQASDAEVQQLIKGYREQK